MNARVEEHQQHADAWFAKIESLFKGKLDGEKAVELYAHVKSCDRCEKVFNRFATAEKALFGEKHAMPSFASDRVASRLFVDAKKPGARPAIIGIAFASALSLMLLVGIVPRTTERAEEFRARSGSTAGVKTDAMLRAFAVALGSDGELDVRDLASSQSKPKVGDRIKLLYSNFGPYSYASAVIIDAGGKTIARIAPALIDRNVEDTDLAPAIPLPDDVTAGPMKIIVVFSTNANGAAGAGSPSEPASADRIVRVIETELESNSGARP
jgi:hypothetical protein